MKILVFGMLADDIGSSEILLDLPKDTNILRAELLKRFPALAARQFVIAINKQKADGNHTLKDGDEIALIPPFAGG